MPGEAAAVGNPVYFIGGTFGAGGSGWWIAFITALLTASATLGVGLALERYKRHRDAQALAAAFVAEISTAVQLFDQLQIVERYRALRDILQRQEAPNAVAESPADALTFPTTVYEKCADRIGTLGREQAAGIVRFYNFLSGFRTGVRIAIGAGSKGQRIGMLDFMLDAVASERPKIEDLLKKLRVIADEPLGISHGAGVRLRKA